MSKNTKTPLRNLQDPLRLQGGHLKDAPESLGRFFVDARDPKMLSERSACASAYEVAIKLGIIFLSSLLSPPPVI